MSHSDAVPPTPLLAKTELVTMIAELLAAKQHAGSLNVSHDSNLDSSGSWVASESVLFYACRSPRLDCIGCGGLCV
jgi:hypothetical protein